MHYNPLPRLDTDSGSLRASLLPHCRLHKGEVWCDPEGCHIVACGDAADSHFVKRLFDKRRASLAVQDPPYNIVMGERLPADDYAAWCRDWIAATAAVLDRDAALYVWLGADQDNHFQPLPQFMTMMARTDFRSRSMITLRNQRGYGTRKNWMAVRQELLYYTRGNPTFEVQYTDVPKILRGYYKNVGGKRTENGERGKSPTIRPGNVWCDLQQVFYRREENVNGCYAQKPLAAIERILLASSCENDLVADFFAHSGTTVLASERTGRRSISFDLDPIFCEITIRRLERFRRTGKTGWQAGHPFETELPAADKKQSARAAT